MDTDGPVEEAAAVVANADEAGLRELSDDRVVDETFGFDGEFGEDAGVAIAEGLAVRRRVDGLEAGDGVGGWRRVGGDGTEAGGNVGTDGTAGGALFEGQEDGELDGFAGGGVGIDDFENGDAGAIGERDLGDGGKIADGGLDEETGGAIGIGVFDADEE